MQYINLKEKQVKKELLDQEKGLLYLFRIKIWMVLLESQNH